MNDRGAKGAAAELLAAAHLMSQGWYVYRCESPHAPFDLVAYRAGQMIRVEVKSLSVGLGCPSFGTPTNNEWDLLVVVDHRDGRIFTGQTVEQVKADIREHFGWNGDPVLLACGHTVVKIDAHSCNAAQQWPNGASQAILSQDQARLVGEYTKAPSDTTAAPQAASGLSHL